MVKRERLKSEIAVMPIYFARAEIRAVEKHLKPCRRLDLRVTLFMDTGRRSVRCFLPPGKCWTGARDHQRDYQQKTKQRAHVLSSARSLPPAVSRSLSSILPGRSAITDNKVTSLPHQRLRVSLRSCRALRAGSSFCFPSHFAFRDFPSLLPAPCSPADELASPSC